MNINVKQIQIYDNFGFAATKNLFNWLVDFQKKWRNKCDYSRLDCKNLRIVDIF